MSHLTDDQFNIFALVGIVFVLCILAVMVKVWMGEIWRHRRKVADWATTSITYLREGHEPPRIDIDGRTYLVIEQKGKTNGQ